MSAKSHREEFSHAAVQLLDGVLAAIPHSDIPQSLEDRLLVGYVAGTLSSEEAALVESHAANHDLSRRRMVQLSRLVESYKTVPFHELAEEQNDSESSARSEWIQVVRKHVGTVTRNLRGIPPTRWKSLEEMSRDGQDGTTAFKTIWRALFTNAPQGTSADGLLRLGFGFRKGRTAAEADSFILDQMRSFDQLESGVVTLCSGEVSENGDLIVLATVQSPVDASTVFISYTRAGRTLALAEAEIEQGQAQLVLTGLGSFMKLPVGPLPIDTISAQTGGWPERCEVAQVIIDSGPRRAPNLGLPMTRNGNLEIAGYFEETPAGGKWELSLAVSPNSWQVLSRFDIKGVTERPHVITAKLPTTAVDGPFGGALLLKRLGHVQ